MSASAAQVRDLLLYTLWADRVCLKAVAGVRPEDLVRDAGSSFGSVLGTMAHMLASQRVWLLRFSGQPLDPFPSYEDFPDLETLRSGWEETSSELEFFLAALRDEQLAAPLTWTSTEGATYTRPLWQPVIHLVNHSTYHRGQVVTMLRQLGYEPPSTDLIDWFIDRAR